jgi:hypothetical protein
MNASFTFLALALVEDDFEDDAAGVLLLPQPASAVTTLVAPASSRMAAVLLEDLLAKVRLVGINTFSFDMG